MAMKSWDGGPRHVKAEGGGGLLGGMLSGFTKGTAALSLEEFQQEKKKEMYELEQAGRKEIEAIRAKEARKERTFRRAEALHGRNKDREARKEEREAEHEFDAEQQRLRLESEERRAALRYDDEDEDFVTSSQKEKAIEDFQNEILAIAGLEGADWSMARRKMSKDPELSYLLDQFARFKVAVRGDITEEEMWKAFDAYLDITMTEGNPDDAGVTARENDPAGIR